MTDTSAEIIRYTADVVLLSQGKVLLIQRQWDPFEGFWALPGGHVDKKERALFAAARELQEETDISIDPDALSLLGVYDDPDRDPRGRYITAAYTTTLPQPVTPKAGDEAPPGGGRSTSCRSWRSTMPKSSGTSLPDGWSSTSRCMQC